MHAAEKPDSTRSNSKQPDARTVVPRLWQLLLDKAWNDAQSPDERWSNVQLKLMDVGRRCYFGVYVCTWD